MTQDITDERLVELEALTATDVAWTQSAKQELAQAAPALIAEVRRLRAVAGANTDTKPDWSRFVFLDWIGVTGLTLQEALYKYADQADLHETEDVCHCVVCQTLAPMAVWYQEEVRRLKAAATDARNDARAYAAAHEAAERDVRSLEAALAASQEQGAQWQQQAKGAALVEKECERLREALAQYADKGRWSACNGLWANADVIFDFEYPYVAGWDIAAKALAHAGGEGE